ncbi:MAG: hypothetical protein KDK36_18175 [Leptospiraceae bacterium]|nr:hypothetical protein [Leptospiraceae bacterium]
MPQKFKSKLAIPFIVIWTLLIFTFSFFIVGPYIWTPYKVSLCQSSCKKLGGEDFKMQNKKSVGVRTSSDRSNCSCISGQGKTFRGYFVFNNEAIDWFALNLIGITFAAVIVILMVLVPSLFFKIKD